MVSAEAPTLPARGTTLQTYAEYFVGLDAAARADRLIELARHHTYISPINSFAWGVRLHTLPGAYSPDLQEIVDAYNALGGDKPADNITSYFVIQYTGKEFCAYCTPMGDEESEIVFGVSEEDFAQLAREFASNEFTDVNHLL